MELKRKKTLELLDQILEILVTLGVLHFPNSEFGLSFLLLLLIYLCMCAILFNHFLSIILSPPKKKKYPIAKSLERALIDFPGQHQELVQRLYKSLHRLSYPNIHIDKNSLVHDMEVCTESLEKLSMIANEDVSQVCRGKRLESPFVVPKLDVSVHYLILGHKKKKKKRLYILHNHCN